MKAPGALLPGLHACRGVNAFRGAFVLRQAPELRLE